MRRLSGPKLFASDSIEIDESGAVAGFLDHVADHFDEAKVGVIGIENGRMGKEIEHGAIFDGPFQSETNGLEEIVELPPGITEGPDIADGVHGNIDQAGGIDKGLGGGLGFDDAVEHFFGGRFAGFAIGMNGVFATDPLKAEVEQHLLHVFAAVQAVGKSAGSAEAGGSEAEPGFHRFGAETDIFANDLGRGFAFDQPGSAIESVLDILRFGGENENMVVGVVPDGVTFLVELFEPIDVFLFEHLADSEEMDDAAMRFDAARGFDRVAFGFVVEVALFVIPVGDFPAREVAGHFEVERDRDERFVVEGV